jgi:hypothetical protein
MNGKLTLLTIVLILAATVGCASSTRTVRVAVPPRVELRAYPAVGLVTFNSTGDAGLDRLGTQKFLEAVLAAQPGARVVELGSEAQVLASVSGRTWDPATLRAVKEAHRVDVLVLGRVDVDRAKPQFQLSTMLKQMNVRAEVDARLSAKLLETASGATLWTDASQCTTNIAHAQFNDRGQGGFGATDPKATYGDMLDGLVWNITDAFRTHYVTRRVPRDQIVVAGAGD